MWTLLEDGVCLFYRDETLLTYSIWRKTMGLTVIEPVDELVMM